MHFKLHVHLFAVVNPVNLGHNPPFEFFAALLKHGSHEVGFDALANPVGCPNDLILHTPSLAQHLAPW